MKARAVLRQCERLTPPLPLASVTAWPAVATTPSLEAMLPPALLFLKVLSEVSRVRHGTTLSSERDRFIGVAWHIWPSVVGRGASRHADRMPMRPAPVLGGMAAGRRGVGWRTSKRSSAAMGELRAGRRAYATQSRSPDRWRLGIRGGFRGECYTLRTIIFGARPEGRDSSAFAEG